MKILKKSKLISNDILELCVANDRSAQKELYDLLVPYLSSICNRYLRNRSDLEDALQETFINIFSKINLYDPEKAQLKTWAVKIAINCSLKFNEKMYKLNTTEFDSVINLGNEGPAIYAELSNEEMMNFLRKMPLSWFEVFNMYAVEGFSHKEIGQIMGIDEALSRKKLSRARKWLSERESSQSINII
jgi:RNA polymerase sigma factor (sigma-70 family)